MKREAFNHPKMLDLASRLGVTRTHACGIVSNLWNWAADSAPQGNVGKWADGVIAMACDWTGDAAAFIESLIESGWLDRCAEHRLVIHDLEEHAPEWHKTKLKRIKKTFITATIDTQVPGANARASAPGNARTSAHANVTGSAPLYSTLLCSSPLSSTPTEPADAGGSLEPPKAKRAPRKMRGPFTASDVDFPAALDTPEAREAAQRWLDHKRSRGQAYASPESFRVKLEEFARAGPEAFVAAVISSIGNNYAGIYQPKDARNGNRPAPNAAQQFKPGDSLGSV